MMKSVGFLITVGMTVCALTTRAQTESTLYFMNSLPQVVDANPAIMPRYKISVGLPLISSFGAVYSNNGFSYNDFVTKTDGVAKVNLSNFTKNLADKNYVTLTGFADLLRVGVRINPKVYLMASSTLKGYNRTMFQRGLASLLVDGTGPLVGSYSNSSPEEEAIVYLATNIGVAYQLNDKVTIGGRIKYLKGLGNVSTESSSMIVQVDNNYSITATGAGHVRTSGLYNLGKSGYDVASHLSDYLKSSGWGLDIGATYKFMDKLTFGLAFNDIGYIKWTNNTYDYTMDPAKAKYVFDGVDVNQLLNKNTGYLSQQLDSLKNKFQMKEAPSGSYSTMLPGHFYLSGSYELIKNLSFGAVYFGEKFKGRYSSGLTAAVNKHFGKWVSTSLTYTVSNRSYNNIGLGLSFNVAPVQIYVVGDNLLRAPASVVTTGNLNSYLNSSQLLTLRAGLNVVVGWDKGTTKKEKKVEDDSHNPRANVSDAKVKTTYGRSPAKKKTKKSKAKKGPAPRKPKSKTGR